MELSLKEWCSKSCPLPNPTYHLFGIVMHSGMTSCSGHYQAYVKVPTPNITDVNNNCNSKEPIHLKNTHLSPSGNVTKVHSNMEESEPHSFSSSENGTSVGCSTFSSDNKSSGTNQILSPQSSAEKLKTTCISGITRYFHKSRKHSAKETKIENHNEERGGDLPGVEEKQRHHSTPSFSFTGTGNSLNKIQSFQYHGVTSNRSAIRQLNFQDSNGQLDQAKNRKNATNAYDEEMSNSCKRVPETKTFQWIHFDDAEVAILPESDVSTLLSSSESSFTSPYLLFYKLAEP